MKLIYFAGGNNIGVLQSVYEIKNINITKICVASIEPNIEQYKKFALEKKIPLCVFNKTDIHRLFKKECEEILLSVGYRFIIPAIVFNQFQYAVNIHPTLLPKYKGAYSGYAVIENGEEETGITAHIIDEGIDTGDILQQIKIPLTKFDTIKTMSEKISAVAPAFVADVVLTILNGTSKSRKQIFNDDVVYNSKRKPEDSKIDEAKPLIDLYNYIRACDQENFPAYFELQGRKIIVKLEYGSENES